MLSKVINTYLESLFKLALKFLKNMPIYKLLEKRNEIDMNQNNVNFKVTAENAGYAMQQFTVNQQIDAHNKEKEKVFRIRLEKFNEIKTLSEAKELLAKIMPVANEINKFKVGNAKCTVIMRENLIRISVDLENEIFCYNFE